MSPLPHPTLPAHALSRRRFVVTALTAFGAVAVATVSAEEAATPALAAAAGTTRIGAGWTALNQATDPGMGALTPAADAAERGMFGPLLDFPVLPMHATLTRNGHVVSFGTPVRTVAQNGIVFDDWDPASGAHVDTDAANHYDSFCNAAVTLANGRILMVSGQLWNGSSAEMMTMTYDPVTRSQTMGDDLGHRRWYPTALRLTDGRILLLGGAAAGLTGAWQTPDDDSQVAFVPEIGSGTGAWRDLSGAASTALFGADGNRWWYPRAFNGPNGGVVGFSGDRVWSLDPDGQGSVRRTGTLVFDPKVSGSQVMYAPGKILVAGGGQVNNDDPVDATAQAAVLDVRRSRPTSAFTASMRHRRNWLNLTVLPNGEVLANGGTVHGTDGGDGNRVLQAEVWNPRTGRWRTAASNRVTRTYHSTALVLPSGAVFTGGGGNPGPVDEFNAELYYPAYLFTRTAGGAVRWASRPAITAITGHATHGGTVRLRIAQGRSIASASLLTVASVTHSQSTDQRRIPLATTQKGAVVAVRLPSSVHTMPPGDYQLTVLDAHGVPSASQILTIRRGAAGSVTVAPRRGVAAAGGGTVAAVGSSAGAGAVELRTGRTIGLESLARPGTRISRSGARAVTMTVSRASARAARARSSWIVRDGFAGSTGYAFESVDRPGYFLAAPAAGAAGPLTLVRRTSSAAFRARATFSVRKGLMGHDVSLHSTAHPTRFVRTIGSRVVAAAVGESGEAMMSATFDVEDGLATR